MRDVGTWVSLRIPYHTKGWQWPAPEWQVAAQLRPESRVRFTLVAQPECQLTESLPRELLVRLLRFDTSNPPGNEGACVAFVDQLLRFAGLQTKLLTATPGRPNLVARLPGRGAAPPLLLQGHLDVVPARETDWRYPPFGGQIADGYAWGRGALDMKAGVAMMISAVIRAKKTGLVPAGDVILALLADEEAGSRHGAEFLVTDHAELFHGVRFAVGEFGGFSLALSGRRLYPIQVAEKQICCLRATLTGPAGHGSLPIRGAVTARLGRLLSRLGRRKLPVHITPVVREMFNAIATELPALGKPVIAALANPHLTDLTLGLAGSAAAQFDPLLRHTVSPNIIRAGETINVIPDHASVDIDGRILPGYSPQDLIRELRQLLGAGADFTVTQHDPGPAHADLSLFPFLAGILRQHDPRARPVPILMPGATDGRFFSRLGIQSYGFIPMQLPDSFDFSRLIHAANERIPIKALDFGALCMYTLLRDYRNIATSRIVNNA